MYIRGGNDRPSENTIFDQLYEKNGNKGFDHFMTQNSIGNATTRSQMGNTQSQGSKFPAKTNRKMPNFMKPT